MTPARTLCWSLTLLPLFAGHPILAEVAPQRLPDRYAEVVLHVDGMV
ncbi:MAG: hypothetical protein IID45_08415 [Planctomycetes bacterium]|nr:hypothetical protein [Planctomycetota bacterium]